MDVGSYQCQVTSIITKALVHSQSINQCRGSMEILQFHSVQDYPELVQVMLVTIVHYVGVASLSDCDNSLIIAQLLRKMLRKSACSECC